MLPPWSGALKERTRYDAQAHISGATQEHVAGVIQEHVGSTKWVSYRSIWTGPTVTPLRAVLKVDKYIPIVEASPIESEIHPSHKPDGSYSV